jgi:putative spermidine/putrescine transport system substrate-binding protein
LRVGTFGASWKNAQEALIAKKFEGLGGKVLYVTGSPQSNLAKLVAGRGRLPFDMMEVLDAQEGDFIKGGFLAPLDLAKIPNVSHLPKSLYNTNLVANWYTQEGICYLKEKFAQLGVKPPTSYQDLADAKLGNKVLLPDINSGGGLAFVGAVAYAMGGDEKNIKPGLDLVTRIRPKRFWSQGTEVITQFQTGDIVAAGAHVGWCLRAAKSGSVVAFAHPQIKPGVKGTAKLGYWGVMKGSPNVEAAQWYINEFIGSDFQYEFAVLTGIVPVSIPSLKRLGEVPIMKDLAETDPAKIAQQLTIDYKKVDLTEWNDLWNRTVTGTR